MASLGKFEHPIMPQQGTPRKTSQAWRCLALAAIWEGEGKSQVHFRPGLSYPSPAPASSFDPTPH